MTRNQKTVFVLLLAIGLLVRLSYCWLFSSPDELYRFLPDDAMINLAIAENFANGKGYSADGRHNTNSAHHLAVWAGIPFQHLFRGDKTLALRWTLTLASLFAVGSGIFIFLLVYHYTGIYSAMATLFLFVTSPLWFFVGMSGMDPPYTFFFTVFLLYFYFVIIRRGEDERKMHYFWLGVACAFPFVSRTDHAFFTVMIGLDLLVRNRHDLRRLLPHGCLVFAGFLAVTSVLFYSNWTNTGELVPSSVVLYYKLKNVGIELVLSMLNIERIQDFYVANPNIFSLLTGLGQIVISIVFLTLFSPWGLLGLFLVVLTKRYRGLFFQSLRKASGLLYILGIAFAVFFLAYSLIFFNVYQYRYLTPAFLTLFILEGVPIGAVMDVFLRNARRKRVLAGIAVLIFLVSLVPTYLHSLPQGHVPAAAKWINQNAGKGAVIVSASQVGTLAYLTDATIIDIYGKFEGSVIELYENKKMESFLDKSGVEYFVDREGYIRTILRNGGAEDYLDKYFEKIKVMESRKSPVCIFKRKTGMPENAIPGNPM